MTTHFRLIAEWTGDGWRVKTDEYWRLAPGVRVGCYTACLSEAVATIRSMLSNPDVVRERAFNDVTLFSQLWSAQNDKELPSIDINTVEGEINCYYVMLVSEEAVHAIKVPRCRSEIYIGDDFGDNSATFRCKWPRNHAGIHSHWSIYGGDDTITVTWTKDQFLEKWINECISILDDILEKKSLDDPNRVCLAGGACYVGSESATACYKPSANIVTDRSKVTCYGCWTMTIPF